MFEIFESTKIIIDTYYIDIFFVYKYYLELY